VTDKLEQTYRIPQVAKALSVTNKTVYRMLSDGRLLGFKVGNRWRVRVISMNAYMKAYTVKR